MTDQEAPLTSEQLENFHRNGFLVVPNVLDDACREYFDAALSPILNHFDKADEYTRRSMATGDARGDEVPGVMIRNADGSDPLPDLGQECLLQNVKLVSILDQLHGADNWEWLHPTNVGWIHVRLPVSSSTACEYRWHLDGGHFNPHYLTSPDQSVVVLPILHDVSPGGGNTVVLPQSHHSIAKLLSSCPHGIDKRMTQDCRVLVGHWTGPPAQEVAPCRAGDLVILHPFVIHAAGFHTNPSIQTRRVTFNLGVKWKKELNMADPNKSWLEASIQRSLESSDSSWIDQTIWGK
jgi:ectoine hydroxylase-related dioxygenase (phytanoyl-CoA dioxygenase family)